MAVISTFPLLNLPTAPTKPLLRVIQLMPPDGLVILSLLSKKCKDLVVSLKLKPGFNRISVHLRHDVIIGVSYNQMYFMIYFYSLESEFKSQLQTPQSVRFDFTTYAEGARSGQFELNNNTLGIGDWLEHFQTIFDQPWIGSISFKEGSSQYDFTTVRRLFKTVKRLALWDTGSNNYNELILKDYTHAEHLYIHDFNILRSHPQLLIRNLDGIGVGCLSPSAILTLDHLLLINSRQIRVSDRRLTSKEINKFVKLWMKGCNSRMEYIRFGCKRRILLDAGIIMKGIKCEEISILRKRVFKSTGSLFEMIVYGGIDIMRKDGIMATIYLNGSHNDFDVQLFVWHDHCVVNNCS